MDDCLFCRIISGQIPARRVYEDDACIAFEDIHPQAPTHVLIVPRRHLTDLNALTADDDRVVGSIHRVAAAIAGRLGIAGRGYRLVTNTGVDGGQTVPHLHFHLLGGRNLTWPPG